MPPVTLNLTGSWFDRQFVTYPRLPDARRLCGARPLGLVDVSSDGPRPEDRQKARRALTGRVRARLSGQPALYQSVIRSVARFRHLLLRLFPPAGDLVYAYLRTELLQQFDPSAEKDFYRDHLVHQIQVAYTLDALLRSRVEPWRRVRFDETWGADHPDSVLSAAVAQLEGNSFFMDYVDHLGLDGIRCETVHAACWLGALVHDMGYLDQYHREVGHEVAAVLPYHPGVPDVSEERLDELLRGTLVKRYLEMVVPGFPTAARGAQLIQRWLRSTHSASSTLMLLGHLKAAPLAYQSEPELQLMVNLAALAALKHDFPEKVPPARIVRVAWSGPTEPWVADPVSYLLMLADQIQEFNRARLEWTPKLRRVVPCPKARLRSRTESPAGQRVLNIRFEFASGHEGSRDHARETLERVYGEPQQDSGWSALDSVLGRLEFDVR